MDKYKVVIHHSEIGLKGKNRVNFEKQLIKNIRLACLETDIKVLEVRREDNRLIGCFSGKKSVLVDVLSRRFGIKYFGIGNEIGKERSKLLSCARKLLRKDFKKGYSMKVRAKRSDKFFGMTSREINEELGDIACDIGYGIDLDNPDLTLKVEVTNEKIYLYAEEFRGFGGLPVGTSPRILCLFSGGIDSCLAAWLIMKRGCPVDFLHIHALQDLKGIQKTKIPRIFEELNRYQQKSKLLLVPYHHFQLGVQNVEEQYELVLFKHFILRLAQKAVEEGHYSAIVTGDSLGQVASQTLPNLLTAQTGISSEIFRPLLTYDKDEIILLGQKLSLFEMCVEPYKDCCSIVSKNPITKMRPSKLEMVLRNFSIEKVVERSFEELEIFK